MRLAAAKRVAELCTVHATLSHPPELEVLSSAEVPDHDHDRRPAAPAASEAVAP